MSRFHYRQVLYRYELDVVGFSDEFDYPVGVEIRPRLEEWVVNKLTPKGAWIECSAKCQCRWVSDRTCFAWETREQAIESACVRCQMALEYADQRKRLAEMRLVAAMALK